MSKFKVLKSFSLFSIKITESCQFFVQKSKKKTLAQKHLIVLMNNYHLSLNL